MFKIFKNLVAVLSWVLFPVLFLYYLIRANLNWWKQKPIDIRNRRQRREHLQKNRFRGNNKGVALDGQKKKTMQRVPIIKSFRNPSKNDHNRISYTIDGGKIIFHKQ